MSLWSDPVIIGSSGGGSSGTDTGLGWYADGAWLTNQAVTIGSISTPSSITPWPRTETAYGFMDRYTGFTVYAAALNDDTFLFRIAGDDPLYIRAATHSASVGIFFKSGWDATGIVSLSFPNTLDGVNYTNPEKPRQVTEIYDVIPTFDTAQAAINAINANANRNSLSTDFAKASPGYSVTCMCKWRESLGGDVYCSPILISSVENNTAYTRNSTDITNVSDYKIGVTTFYIRNSTDDTLSGTETLTFNVPVLDLTEEGTFTNEQLFYMVAANANIQLEVGG